ncbi:tetratricopeptide repeat protein [Lapidilactobacillus luobeiensis]|uniref:tetratricopeptide repeat protein n=1 Tax=Lapidilactobacillus luobeiensis TaxID=2950371 RepID=UPI0021C47A28|nr:hypothetical protein [Lapidilactobacillus luobeiensis]
MTGHNWAQKLGLLSVFGSIVLILGACQQKPRATLYQRSFDQGVAALAANNMARAQDYFEDALKEAPRDQSAKLMLAQTNHYLVAQKAFGQGDLRQAAAELDRMDQRANLAESLKAAGAELRQVIQTATKEATTVTTQIAQVQTVYAQRDYQAANTLLIKMDTIDWRNKPYLAKLHTQYSELGRSVLQHLLQQRPSDVLLPEQVKTPAEVAGRDPVATDNEAATEATDPNNATASDNTTQELVVSQTTASYYRQLLVRIMGYSLATITQIPDAAIDEAFAQAQEKMGDARIAATILEANYPQLLVERRQSSVTTLTTTTAEELAQKYWEKANQLAQQDCEPMLTTTNAETGTITVHFVGVGEPNYTYLLDFTATGQINWQDSTGNLRVLGVWK